MATSWWKAQGAGVPRQYLRSYEYALRRMAVLLNCARRGAGVRKGWLDLSDAELAKQVAQAGSKARSLNNALFAHLAVTRLGTAGSAPHDFDDAENIFYGDFRFEPARGYDPVVRATHTSTPAFRSWALQRLFWPEDPATKKPLKPRAGETSSEFMTAAAANYLLKNFWHNYVHRVTQGITSENYHVFGGDARYESDFVADNIAALLLARSYGLTILTKGQTSAARQRRVEELVARNRCNLVFAEREKHRLKPVAGMKADERWEEAEWMFRRRVAVATGNELLRLGASTVDVAVYLPGPVSPAGGWFFRRGRVVVRLNGLYIETSKPPYILDPAQKATPQRAESARRRPSEVAVNAAGSYVARLQADARLRSNAERALQGFSERVDIPLLD